jgi:hypothetical protein
MKKLHFGILCMIAFLQISYLFGQEQPTVYNVDVLYNEIEENAIKTNLAYAGKKISIKGFIVDFEHQRYVCLAEKDTWVAFMKASVTILDTEIPKFADLYLGQEVIIEGIWKENSTYVEIHSGKLITAYPLTIQPRTISMDPAVPREILTNTGGKIIDASMIGRQGRDNSIWVYQAYNGKRLKMQGKILDISISNGQGIVEIGDDDDSDVRIWFQKGENNKIVNLRKGQRKGQTITVEGICGYFHAYRWPELNNAILISP